jgi:hypothetical protein
VVEVPPSLTFRRLIAPTFIAAAKDLLAGETGVRAQLTRRRLTRPAELTAEIQEVAGPNAVHCNHNCDQAPTRPQNVRR